MIGNAGLTDGVLAELERSLLAHELVKLRVNAEREQRDQIMTELCQRTGAMAVQHIGKMLVVFRSSPVLRAKRSARCQGAADCGAQCPRWYRTQTRRSVTRCASAGRRQATAP